MRSEGKFVVGVLVASAAVALILAFQAVSSARSRQAITDGMLRQYAELAATEFARAAKRGIEMSVSRRLTSFVHPRMNDHCDCAPLKAEDYYFEVAPDGAVVERSGTMPPAMRQEIAGIVGGERGGAEGSTRLRFLAADPDRFVAMRPEPHAPAGGGVIGLVAPRSALVPMLEYAHRRTTLLPAALLDGRESRGAVNLRVTNAAGDVLFRSEGTTAGPQAAEADLASTEGVLRVSAAMTPEFIARLGPEHAGGWNVALVVGLVVVNLLMVGVGLRQLARERELARLREDFVAGVSHELRTPLAQIRMFADTLRLDRIRNPHEGRRAIEIISQETRRLSQLVENVLYFHRHRRKPESPQGVPTNLSLLVMEVVEGFKPLAASKRARLSTLIPAHEVIVIANSDGMRQVLLNLLDNAVKFSPSDSQVSVSVQTGDGTARLVVEDQGKGVPVADRRRIFEPFERGSDRATGGAGIGLAVVRQIVTEHRGAASVESAASGGARFIIELPLVSEEPHLQAMAG